MQPFAFGASELTGIVSYLRNMSSFDARGSVVGNAGRGQAIFAGAGNCSSCQCRERERPPWSLPTSATSVRCAQRICFHRKLIDPAGSLLPVNRSVHAVTKDGKSINGRRLNEDTYTVTDHRRARAPAISYQSRPPRIHGPQNHFHAILQRQVQRAGIGRS